MPSFAFMLLSGAPHAASNLDSGSPTHVCITSAVLVQPTRSRSEAIAATDLYFLGAFLTITTTSCSIETSQPEANPLVDWELANRDQATQWPLSREALDIATASQPVGLEAAFLRQRSTAPDQENPNATGHTKHVAKTKTLFSDRSHMTNR